MTRVSSRRAVSANAARARSRMVRAKFGKHKVIMESITQAKKKLRSVISFEAKAPPGYTFIPAGNPQFTVACKEMCRKDGLKVFAVTTTPHQRMHDLSQQVHRIGYHFPSAVVATVCMELGLYLTSTGKVIPFEDLDNKPPSRRADSEVSQTTINTEARDVIRDLFPNIPDKDLNQIIKTAFQKGQRKVGTAIELPLARRAQLAVVAHIRHVYTDYDRLLKITSFQEARSIVEEPTLEKLVQWRGDDENGKTELEDIFREVIVISDDDEDDDDSATDYANGLFRADRDSSVEIVSSNTLAEELHTKPVNYANLSKETFLDPADDEAPPGFRFVSGVPPRNKVDRRGFSRYQAWDRARDRYRERISIPEQGPFPGAQVDHDSYIPQQPLYETINSSFGSRRDRQVAIIQPLPGRAFDSLNLGRAEFSGNAVQPPEALFRRDTDMSYSARFPPHHVPSVLRFHDGSVFEKIPASVPEEAVGRLTNISASPVCVSGPSSSLRVHENSRKRIYPSENVAFHQERVDLFPQDRIVLPSIEVPESPTSARQAADHRTRYTHRGPGEFQGHSEMYSRPAVEDLSRRINAIRVTDNRSESSKRRRLEYDETPHYFSHRQSLPVVGRQPVFTQSFERPERQHITLGEPGIQPRSSRNDDQFYRMQVIPHESQQTMRHQPERIQVHELSPLPSRQPDSDISRPMTQAFSHRSNAAVILDSSQDTVGSIREYPIHSRFASLSHRDLPVRNEFYVADPGSVHNSSDAQPLYVRSGRDLPGLHGPARGIDPDTSAWRSKANLYESERRNINSNGSSWPDGMHSPAFHSLHASQPRPPDVENIFSPRPHDPEATGSSRDRGSLRRDTGLHQHPAAHQPRAKSQVPMTSLDDADSVKQHGSYLSRAKQGLPPSAVRRYEVQLGKTLDPIRYASMPRRALQENEKSSHPASRREGQSYPYRRRPAEESPIIVD